MSDYNSQAIVLGRRSYKEKDLLFDLFTARYGKLTLILKSGLKVSNKMVGHLDLGSIVEIEWAGGRYFDLITGASGEFNLRFVRDDLNKIIYLKSALKVLSKVLIEKEPNLEIYKISLDFLIGLNSVENSLNLELIYQAWWWQVLNELGMAPNLKNIKEQNNVFDFELGGLIDVSRFKHDTSAPLGDRARIYTRDEIELVNKLIVQSIESCMKAKVEVDLVRKGREILQNFVAWRDINVGQEVFARKLS